MYILYLRWVHDVNKASVDFWSHMGHEHRCPGRSFVGLIDPPRPSLYVWTLTLTSVPKTTPEKQKKKSIVVMQNDLTRAEDTLAWLPMSSVML